MSYKHGKIISAFDSRLRMIEKALRDGKAPDDWTDYNNQASGWYEWKRETLRFGAHPHSRRDCEIGEITVSLIKDKATITDRFGWACDSPKAEFHQSLDVSGEYFRMNSGKLVPDLQRIDLIACTLTPDNEIQPAWPVWMAVPDSLVEGNGAVLRVPGLPYEAAAYRPALDFPDALQRLEDRRGYGCHFYEWSTPDRVQALLRG